MRQRAAASSIPGKTSEDQTKLLQGVRLGRLVSLGAKIGSSRAALREETGEDRLNEGTEDDLGATKAFISITDSNG